MRPRLSGFLHLSGFTPEIRLINWKPSNLNT